MKRIILGAMAVAGSLQGGATDILWTGSGDGKTWAGKANWNPQQVPTAADNAIFEVAAMLEDTLNVHGEMTVRNGVVVKATETVLGENSGESALLDLTGSGTQVDVEKLTVGGASGGCGKVIAQNGGLLLVGRTDNAANRLTVAAGAVPASGDVIDVAELGAGQHRIARLANQSVYPARIKFTEKDAGLYLATATAGYWVNSIATENWIFEADAPAEIKLSCPPSHYLTPSGNNKKCLKTQGSGCLHFAAGTIYTLSACICNTGGMTVDASVSYLGFVDNGVEMQMMRGPLTVNGKLAAGNNPIYADGLVVGPAGSVTTSSRQDFVFGSGDRDGSLSATLPSSNRVVKVGSGTLTVSGVTSAGDFALSNGTLKVAASLTLSSLTTENGTTLIVDGADLVLGRLVQHGAVTVLTYNGGRILCGDTGLTELVRPVLGGEFVKVGSGKTTIYEPVALPAGLHVGEGELAFSKYGLSQRYWKWTFKGVSNGPSPLTSLGKVWLHGADGNRVGDGITYAAYNANADLTAKDSYKGKATWVCGGNTNVNHNLPYLSYQDAYTGINEMFTYNGAINAFPYLGSPVIDKANPDSYLALEIRFRDSDGPIVGYNFGLTTQTTGRPTDWTVEVSDDGQNWMTVDERSNVTLPPNTYGIFYDGLVYENRKLPDPPPAETFHLTGYLREGLEPLSTPLAVQVDEGAKLNFKAFTGGQGVSSLTYDAELGGGEIVGADILKNGTFYYNGADKPKGGVILPLVLTDCLELKNIETWSVVINGKSTAWRVSVKDGKLMLMSPGLVLIFR